MFSKSVQPSPPVHSYCRLRACSYSQEIVDVRVVGSGRVAVASNTEQVRPPLPIPLLIP